MDVPDGFTVFPRQGPFLEHIGPIHVREDADGPVLGLRAEARHANHRGTVQGGLLATFADFTLGRAIAADAEDGRERATVNLGVDYLAPAARRLDRGARAGRPRGGHAELRELHADRGRSRDRPRAVGVGGGRLSQPVIGFARPRPFCLSLSRG